MAGFLESFITNFRVIAAWAEAISRKSVPDPKYRLDPKRVTVDTVVALRIAVELLSKKKLTIRIPHPWAPDTNIQGSSVAVVVCDYYTPEGYADNPKKYLQALGVDPLNGALVKIGIRERDW